MMCESDVKLRLIFCEIHALPDPGMIKNGG